MIKVIVAIASVLLALTPQPAGADPQKNCLQQALYFEARGEGWRGMIAVGMVIKNRIASAEYPSSYCGVIRQGFYRNGTPIKNMCQFSFWCDGKPEEIDDESAWQASGHLSDILMSTEITVEGIEKATHYHAFYVSPKWAKTHMKMGKIGHHIFYRFASVN